jgi:hypothetical protein
MSTKSPAGPILDTHLPQLKACGDGLAACGDLHAAALVHALHSHFMHMYQSEAYLAAIMNSSADLPENDVETARRAAAVDKMIGTTTRQVFRVAGISLAKKYTIEELDTLMAAVNIPSRDCTGAKWDAQSAGMIVKAA